MIDKIRTWIEKELSVENKIYNKLNHCKNKLTIKYKKTNIAYIFISNKNITYVDLIFGEVIKYKSDLSISLVLKKLDEIELNSCVVFDEYGSIRGE